MSLRRSILPEIAPIIVIGLLVRAVLWVYTSEADLSTFAGISQSLVYGYKPYVYINIYPPGWNVALGLVGRLTALVLSPSNFLGGNSLATQLAPFGSEPTAFAAPQYAVIEKGFLSVFDLISGLVIVAIAKRAGFRRLEDKWVFALWFLNPLVITVSAVHGNYDVVTTTFVLMAAYLCLDRSWFFAAVSLSIGGILSLYPLLLAPLILGYAMITPVPLLAWRRVVHVLSGLCVPILLVLWPPRLFEQFVTNLLTGTSVGLTPGGFWIWSTTSLPGFSPWQTFVLNHSAAIVTLCSITTVASAIAVALHVVLRRPQVTSKGTVAYFGLATIATYTILPITQPQNIIWVLPFALLFVTQDRSAILMFVTITVLPFLFYWISLGGPYFLLTGFAVYTSILKPSVVVASIRYFSHLRGVTFPLTQVPTFLALVLLADKFLWKLSVWSKR